MTGARPWPQGTPVEAVDPARDIRWRELVLSRDSQVFHSPAWATVLEETYGFGVTAHVVVDGETPTAGMVFVDVDDPRGARIVSLPFSDFCDPLVSNSTDWGRLEDQLPLDSVPVTVRTLHNPIDSPRWEETGSYAWHRVDTSRSTEEAWDALHPSARRAIRKAGNEGVEITVADSEADLRAFFDLHLKVRKHKYGLLAQPYRFFQSIWQNFLLPGEGRLLLARADSRVVGGVLYLKWKDTLYYKFNASDPGGLGVRPNDLLVWEGLRFAHESGLRWFDFGVSDWDQEGLVRYKRKYATEEGVVRKYRAGPASEDSLGPVLGRLTEVLTGADVPDAATEQAGDLLYRFFC